MLVRDAKPCRTTSSNSVYFICHAFIALQAPLMPTGREKLADVSASLRGKSTMDLGYPGVFI